MERPRSNAEKDEHPNPEVAQETGEPQEDRYATEEAGWRPSRLARLLVLSILAAAGVIYLVAALRLPFGSLQQPGFGFFPVIVGAMLVASAAVTLLRQDAGGQEAASEGTAGFRWKLLGIVAALLVYVLAANVIGHIVSAALISAGVLRLTGDRPWWQMLLFGLAIGLGSYLLFAVVLDMSLPTGIFRLDL